MIDLENLYQKLPYRVQSIILNLEGLRITLRRYGVGYQKIFSEYSERSYLTEEELKIYKEKELRKFLKHANKSPFWNQRFKEYKINLDSKYLLKELNKLPLLTKEVVKKNKDRILIENSNYGGLFKMKTSGTTGSGLNFWRSGVSEKAQFSIWWRNKNLFGIDRNTWCGYFGGRSIKAADDLKSPNYRVNYFGKQILFSGYHLNESTAREYFDILKSRKIEWIHGYPSFVSLFASYVNDLKLGSLNSIKLITTGSENLLEHQIKIIKQVFEVPIVDNYGQTEAVANFSMCTKGLFHVDEDFSYVEFVPSENKKNEFKVIGTNWSNYAFPLIRYDTNDNVIISGQTCGCGSLGRVVDSVDGRKEDYIILPNGTKIGRLDHIFKNMINIKEAQIIQQTVNEVDFHVVKGDNYSIKDESALRKEAILRIGSQIKVNVIYVNEVKKTKSGKLRFVISNI